MSKSYSKTRVLVECALMVAIGTVLANIKIFTMPNGGSVTLLSMLPFVLVSFRHGVKWGLFTGLVNGCLQMLLGFWAPPTPTFIYFLGEILLDYLVAFMALGTAEFFARPFKNRMVGVAVGTAIAGFLRFMCSFLSGVLVWGPVPCPGRARSGGRRTAPPNPSGRQCSRRWAQFRRRGS